MSQELFGVVPAEKIASECSIAIVGNSPCLINSCLGSEIDSHDVVFRFNGAVTSGHEKDVGTKTSYMCWGIDIGNLFCPPFSWVTTNSPEAEKVVIRSTNARKFWQLNPTITSICFKTDSTPDHLIEPNPQYHTGMYLELALRDLMNIEPQRHTGQIIHYSEVGSVAMNHYYEANRFLKQLGLEKRLMFGSPRTGFRMIVRSILSGFQPDLYGFDLSQEISISKHYHDNILADKIDDRTDHDARSERDVTLEMAEKKLVVLRKVC